MVVNELDPLAKLSGLPEISRKSIFKALSHKAAGRRASRELGSDYEKLNLIVGHLGKSISVAAHEKGKVIDVNNSVDGDGPFSLQKCGKLPVGDMIRLAFSGRYSREEIQFKLLKEGGVTSYLGVGEMKKINQLIDSGNENARLIYEGMAYQTAKEIGACAAALKGKVDAVVLTGDLAADKRLVNWIKERISFLGKVLVYPDDDEMLFLVQGVLRILDKQEEVKTY
ncbi:MAG: hypothetical protein CVU88_05860 [Firmicutes bacterium HGW-Firmicutes-13]|nr:MAG: hypothetical protein CVU88_05860 [Firmicutes bacterium HGW-Firmicutes-13]